MTTLEYNVKGKHVLGNAYVYGNALIEKTTDYLLAGYYDSMAN